MRLILLGFYCWAIWTSVSVFSKHDFAPEVAGDDNFALPETISESEIMPDLPTIFEGGLIRKTDKFTLPDEPQPAEQ